MALVSPIAAKLVGDSELGTRLGNSDLGAAASTKAIWWDFRLASLLTHLLLSHHMVVGGILSLLYVIFFVILFFVRLRISQRRKEIGA